METIPNPPSFYDEDVYEIIMLWQIFGTTRNIVLWEIMLQKKLCQARKCCIEINSQRKIFVNVDFFKIYH